MKKQFAAMLLGASLIATPAFASDLEHSMEQLQKNHKAFGAATTNAQALTALNKMKAASATASKSYPRKVNSKDAAQVKAYQDSFIKLNGTLDQAIVLVKQNRLRDAKKLAVTIDQIKMEGHKRYR